MIFTSLKARLGPGVTTLANRMIQLARLWKVSNSSYTGCNYLPTLLVSCAKRQRCLSKQQWLFTKSRTKCLSIGSQGQINFVHTKWISQRGIARVTDLGSTNGVVGLREQVLSFKLSYFWALKSFWVKSYRGLKKLNEKNIYFSNFKHDLRSNPVFSRMWYLRAQLGIINDSNIA